MSYKKSILITGINGFLAHNIGKYLKEKGYYIIGSVSSSEKLEKIDSYVDQMIVLNLKDTNINELKKLTPSVVIHCAYDKTFRENNVKGTKTIANFFPNAYQIFLSSISASEENESDYGSAKLELEKYFSELKESLIIRPGLVIGNGGLYKNMNQFIENHKLIPLPDGGIYPMAVIEIESLVKHIDEYISSHVTGVKNLYNVNLVSLREIVLDIAKKKNKKVILLKIPITLVELVSPIVSFLMKVLGMKINFDSILGYKLYRNMKLPNSNLISNL